jgi:hypothetical protein
MKKHCATIKNNNNNNKKNQTESLTAFWIYIKKEKPVLENDNLKVLLPFVTY